MLGRQLFEPGGDYHSRTLDRWAANPGRREGAIVEEAVPVPRAPSVDPSFFVSLRLTHGGFRGHTMNIDLDSWEAGYAHGQQGGLPRCAVDLDQVSYLSGFYHGRAWRAQSHSKSPSLSRSLAKRADRLR
jgi:hypothetical protein